MFVTCVLCVSVGVGVLCVCVVCVCVCVCVCVYGCGCVGVGVLCVCVGVGVLCVCCVCVVCVCVYGCGCVGVGVLCVCVCAGRIPISCYYVSLTVNSAILCPFPSLFFYRPSCAVDTNGYGMYKTTSVVCEFQPHNYETHSFSGRPKVARLHFSHVYDCVVLCVHF